MTAAQRTQIVGLGTQVNFDTLVPICSINIVPVRFVHWFFCAVGCALTTDARFFKRRGSGVLSCNVYLGEHQDLTKHWTPLCYSFCEFFVLSPGGELACCHFVA
jgi:hypothetical protein